MHVKSFDGLKGRVPLYNVIKMLSCHFYEGAHSFFNVQFTVHCLFMNMDYMEFTVHHKKWKKNCVNSKKYGLKYNQTHMCI